MSNRLDYKGYSTSIEIDFPSHLLYGKIEGIRDYVNFESESVEGIEQEFRSAVDDYLEFLEEARCGEAKEA
ncbi:MAG: hypothetical protein IJF90_04845 [Synergistaceae bacterium]|nr:hypothetical protein [Synergistaceae bacterium]MBQ2675338.1 hypothetical protein [Prevotella sp.]MBQ6148897.1 hypothetical protein [Oscillospiraceae bacterium]